jgi:hypothetical protein
MFVPWLRVLSILIPVALFAGSMVLLGKARTMCTTLQALGSGCFLGVVLFHGSVGFRAWTNWLAVVGLAVFSAAFLVYSLSK